MHHRTDLARSTLRLVCALIMACGVLLPLLEGTALATLEFKGQVSRTGGKDRDIFKFYINRAECLSDSDTFTFNFSVAGGETGENLEVWATTYTGIDCTNIDDRNSTTGQCKRVTSPVTTKTTTTITLKSRDIVNAVVSEMLKDECTEDSGTGKPRQITLTFMILVNEVAQPGSSVTFPQGNYNIGLDLTAPAPPEAVEVTPAEGSLDVSITPDPSVDTEDINHYNIYCDPPGESVESTSGCGCTNPGSTGTGGTGGASNTTQAVPPAPQGAAGSGGIGGTGGMGGTGGTGGTGGAAGASTTAGSGGASGGAGGSGGSAEACVNDLDNCFSCNLKAGEDAPGDGYLCGRIDGDKTSGAANGLTNGTRTTVAIAAVDDVGNVGKLSISQCGDPQEVQDFFEEYDSAGGEGGGGCSIQAFWQAGFTGFGGPLLGALTGAAFLLRRRRRAKTESQKRSVGGAQ